MSVTWRGINTIQPSAVVYTDTSGLSTVGLSASGIIAKIATATGGTPNTAVKYTDAATARNTFRSGDLLTAAEHAWGEGARAIYLTRLGATSGTAADQPCQQATLALETSSVGALSLSSIDYGSWTNNIKAKVETGTSSGKKITIQYYNSSTGVTTTETGDNLADAAAMSGWVSNNSGLCSGTVLSGALVPDSISYTNLTNGGDGTSPTTTNWQTAIDLYDDLDVDIIYVGSSSSTVHGLVSTHVSARSAVNRERIGVVGGTTGLSVGDWETDDSIINNAYDLNSDRMVYVSPGLSSATPYLATASKVCGALAAVDVASPLTHKSLSATAIETKFTSTQKDDLITYGVCAMEQVPSGRRIIRGITTAQDLSLTTEHPFKEISTRRIADYVNKTVRTNLEGIYIGKKGIDGIESSMAADTTALLLMMKEQQIVVGFKDVVAYKDTSDATVYYVSYKVAPVQPVNYILITTVLTNVL